MKKNQRTYLLIAGGALLVFIIYRYQQSRAAGAGNQSQAAQTASQDTVGASYAQLAGQQQADMAALSNQEQSDVGTITSNLANAVATEQSDLANMIADLHALRAHENGQISGLDASLADLQNQLNSLQVAQAAAPPPAASSPAPTPAPTQSQAASLSSANYNAIFNEGYNLGYDAIFGRGHQGVTFAPSNSQLGISADQWNQIFNTGYIAGNNAGAVRKPGLQSLIGGGHA